MHILFIFLLSSFVTILITDAKRGTTVKIRVEGLHDTIYVYFYVFIYSFLYYIFLFCFFLLQESTVITRGRNITTASGGTHRCDGTNLNSNPEPGPSATSALADAADQGHFTWDATYSSQYDDFFITRIANNQQTSKQFWGILVNYNYTKVGGCQARIRLYDEVLFAFDAFNKKFFLKLTGPLNVHRGVEVIYTVTDGSTGLPIFGAKIGKYVSDSQGNINITFTKTGRQKLKAEQDESIRSNAVYVRVN